MKRGDLVTSGLTFSIALISDKNEWSAVTLEPGEVAVLIEPAGGPRDDAEIVKILAPRGPGWIHPSCLTVLSELPPQE